MKLSLSTRVAEAPKPRKDVALMDLPELARLAHRVPPGNCSSM